ncbi:trypsin-like serine peptidase [Streptomyces flaveolus]|uniref:trypsin-like serine peptidase n=1 Tax=Streptomyces flaveolus TaxID=67297 RepID=UPI0033D7E20A
MKGHWSPDRMSDSTDPDVSTADDFTNVGVSDPEPRPVPAHPTTPPYHFTAPMVGKVFFDSPDGPKVCSGTAVQDPAAPGRSNLVWTAGHCVHMGADGGWFRNVVFVPSYNDEGPSGAAERDAPPLDQVAPFGTWWADWAETSPQWTSEGTDAGSKGSPFNFAVVHVRPAAGASSLEETIGAAAPVRFDVPAADSLSTTSVWGYPADKPFDGESMFSCQDRSSRLSVSKNTPTMYRIGCTMTGGSSGSGWFAPGPDGSMSLISNTSIGSTAHTWHAGPPLGQQAEKVYRTVSDRFAGTKNDTL